MHQQIKDKLHYYIKSSIKLSHLGNSSTIKIDGLNYAFILSDSKEFKPHLHPLSSLTKEITVPGYNDGNPFVPMDVIHQKLSNGKGHVNVDNDRDYFSIYAGLYDDTWPADLGIYELLFRWHFWLWDQSFFESGEIIEIKD